MIIKTGVKVGGTVDSCLVIFSMNISSVYCSGSISLSQVFQWPDLLVLWMCSLWGIMSYFIFGASSSNLNLSVLQYFRLYWIIITDAFTDASTCLFGCLNHISTSYFEMIKMISTFTCKICKVARKSCQIKVME